VAKIEKDEVVANRNHVASKFKEKWRSRAIRFSAKTDSWVEAVVTISSFLVIAAIVVLTYRVFHQH
jgi:hypothetical protein